jgi:hypothetical protein
MKACLCLLLCILGAGAAMAQGARDPFWPIGYTPGAPSLAPTNPTTPVEQATAALTPKQLQELAEKEAQEIRQTLKKQGRQGTAFFNNRFSAYYQGRWVSVGDSITVDVNGTKYRLEILQLTHDNIELEAHRMAESPQP